MDQELFQTPQDFHAQAANLLNDKKVMVEGDDNGFVFHCDGCDKPIHRVHGAPFSGAGLEDQKRIIPKRRRRRQHGHGGDMALDARGIPPGNSTQQLQSHRFAENGIAAVDGVGCRRPDCGRRLRMKDVNPDGGIDQRCHNARLCSRSRARVSRQSGKSTRNLPDITSSESSRRRFSIKLSDTSLTIAGPFFFSR